MISKYIQHSLQVFNNATPTSLTAIRIHLYLPPSTEEYKCLNFPRAAKTYSVGTMVLKYSLCLHFFSHLQTDIPSKALFTLSRTVPYNPNTSSRAAPTG